MRATWSGVATFAYDDEHSCLAVARSGRSRQALVNPEQAEHFSILMYLASGSCTLTSQTQHA